MEAGGCSLKPTASNATGVPESRGQELDLEPSHEMTVLMMREEWADDDERGR